ncbi:MULTISPECIES: hypothetical protein [unclassified Stenotrophomonas maltophilia group]|uniref:hypothetical protein n=1 Tax=unclassified Stenotrophomonas maltophilia group TaxID=2961925 RepID=UPI003BF7B658
MKLLALALLSAASANAADGIQAVPNDELCIAMAVGMITGSQEVKDSVRPELERRSETCAPADMYIKIAEARIGFMQAKAATPQPPAPEPRPSMRQRIGQAADAYLDFQRQQQLQRQTRPAPTTTTCNSFEGMTTCHTW